MKDLKDLLLYRLGYLRQSYKSTHDWLEQREIYNHIHNVESVLIDMRVINELQRSSL